MPAHDHEIDRLNALLRGELAASETYGQALEKFATSPQMAHLQLIRAEHTQAVLALREQIQHCGGEPERSSGAWGVWSKIVEGAAKLLGERAALTALKQGEEQGISDYQEALEDAQLSAECKGLIRDRLLPQTKTHLRALDRLMAMQAP